MKLDLADMIFGSLFIFLLAIFPLIMFFGHVKYDCSNVEGKVQQEAFEKCTSAVPATNCMDKFKEIYCIPL
jgi:hypothetical protein